MGPFESNKENELLQILHQEPCSQHFFFFRTYLRPNKLEWCITLGNKALPSENTLAYWALLKVMKKMKCCEYNTRLLGSSWPCKPKNRPNRLARDTLSSLFVTYTSGKGKSFIKLPPGPLVVKLWLE